MARRLNYTKRKRILQEHVRIRLIHDGDALQFDASFDLEHYRFDSITSSPCLYVEAYRRATGSWKRFDFGTTASSVPPGSRSLSDFGTPAGILFRVKITTREGSGVPGRLLAHADRIRPQLPGESDQPVQPLIEHMPASDIGDELWRVDFSGDMPLLKINSKVPMGVEQFLVDPRFRAVFAPAVMRQILTRTLVIDRFAGDEDDDGDWRQRWLKFAETLAGTRPPDYRGSDDLDDVEEWIDQAIEGFAQRARLRVAFEGSDLS